MRRLRRTRRAWTPRSGPSSTDRRKPVSRSSGGAAIGQPRLRFQRPAAATAAVVRERPSARAAPAPVAPAAAQPLAPPPTAEARVQRLSVVLPARNEALNLPSLLQELASVLRSLPLAAVEIVVVDDGSTDGTGELARAAGARVVRHEESLGNGAAVKRGIRESRGEWILLLDADGQHPPAAIPAMVELAERYDMVVGSRGGGGGSLHRNFANRVYNRLASYVSGHRIPDLTSGFRLLRADVARDLVQLLPNTFSYPTTITMTMLKAGYAVVFAAIDIGWYCWTWLTEGRFTNMAVLLLGQATMLFALGLVSEQIGALRNQ